MAWISVHENLVGSKLRSLSKKIGCSQNEAIGLLVRLWLWGLKNTDRDGMIIDADKSDIAAALTTGISENISAGQSVEAMIQCEWLDEDDGRLYIHDWKSWQKQWYRYCDTRAKDAERKRRATETYGIEKDVGNKPNSAKEAMPNELAVQPEKGKPAKRTGKPYTPAFEEFWKAYPRHKGKGEAYAKFKARLNDGWEAEILTTAAKRYGTECAKQHTEEQYIKLAKTFLSENTPFTDYLPSGTFGSTGTAEESKKIDSIDLIKKVLYKQYNIGTKQQQQETTP